MIYYGAHHDDAAGNAYPDCSEAFVQAMNRSVQEGTGGALRIEAPFVRWNKAQIVKEGLRLGVPYELTWSCYEGGDKPLRSLRHLSGSSACVRSERRERPGDERLKRESLLFSKRNGRLSFMLTTLPRAA